MKVIFACFATGLFLFSALAQQGGSNNGTGPVVVSAYHPNLTEIQPALHAFDIWRIDPKINSVLLAVEQDRLAELTNLGFTWRIDEHRTKLMNRSFKALPGQAAGIPGFPCYRTVEETFAAAEGLVTAYPDLATWTDVGDSWIKTQDVQNGYDLFVLKLTNSLIGGDKPKMFITSAIHAREYTTAELMTRFAEFMLDNYQTDPNVRWLLDHHEIHLMLQTNPDGRKQAETGLSWRKNANNDFCTGSNNRGIDLNRNFTFQWGCCNGSSSSPCDQTFRGPFAGSEPETDAVQAYITGLFPDQRPDDLTTPAPADATGIFFDIHSFGEVILSSWGFTGNPPPNVDGITTLMRKLGFYNGYEPHLGSLGTVDGATKDFAYGTLGVPGYTIELGTNFFQDCTFFEQNILPGHLEGLMQVAKWARTPYITPSGPELEQIDLDQAVVEPGEMLTVQGLVNDDRYSDLGGVEPTQPIQAAEAYVDTPPWSPGATPVPMTAVDGLFDQVAENVEAAIETTGLAEGEHLLYLRGQDTDNNWGAVNATFFYVLDPLTAPKIEGTVTDLSTGLPVAAAVSTGLVTGASDPVTGFYQLLVPPGTHTLTVSADGFADQAVGGVTVVSLQTAIVDFGLTPVCVTYGDDMESGVQGWNANGTWALSTETANSPITAWSDSPGGDYGNNVNMSLTSQTIDISGLDPVSLRFWHQYNLESGFDFGNVELSLDGGASFSQLAVFNGVSNGWTEEVIDIPTSGLPEMIVRFRMTSDTSVTRDGWHIDDVSVSGASVTGCSTLTLGQMFEQWPELFDISDLVAFLNQNGPANLKKCIGLSVK